MLESESCLAVAALGLDPGLGFIHVDTPARDSLACDLMEAVRPKVDAYVLDWLRQPMRREWFFEQRDGNCRLMAPFAARLTETAPVWSRAISPVAEWVARTLWSRSRKPASESDPPTHLTQSRRREVKGVIVRENTDTSAKLENFCRECGARIMSKSRLCERCKNHGLKQQIQEVAKLGRAATHSAEAEARRSETQKRQANARWNWEPSQQAACLTQRTYEEKIKPRLAEVMVSAIADTLNVSYPYAAKIRNGERRPHARHWLALSELTGVPE